MSGAGSLSVTWNAPSSDGGLAITAYDLRYVPSDAPSKADADWTVVRVSASKKPDRTNLHAKRLIPIDTFRKPFSYIRKKP